MTTGDVDRQRFWTELRLNTQARIGLDRAGNALHTRDVLDLAAAHATARDAVHVPLDTERLAAEVAGIGVGTPAVVTSQVRSRAEYLRRPDLGRLPTDLSAVPPQAADIGIVLADGLSPTALMRHGVPLVRELVLRLGDSYTLAAPVIATQARVALGDHIAAKGRYRTLIVVIGERPGLSVVDSLGIYLTHLPRPGCTDADRNCISNIHPPDGLSYREAAHIAASLVSGARQLGRSGVALKDTSRASAIDDAGQGALG
ncbi:ethanolamine ammonia-lyase subunit EutC [Mycobacteroides franklinii]|uniref:Ethanolamine ammonia-lyase small subunit n=1 Tax=Mycobacteroides franklinii TaxID=948102 RepID=A0A4V3HUN6_9MYCO|nr:ethanolamine ammonia-lyase subunit EutC [Mycobacteroides franklinii]TDZ45482.1 Ethanolamine ammonia-lyase light chain [Mycobacteroides franklinii]TDZ48973.1 Ethanolamine ammonia-lyase light chain [Mycobacteroides franklinii]TDZ59154.1 Ethanolamine ammonia-lyase light chain [Mycobacteroides franklinii]TDZ66668.1 Ethanolamine ammonia-lyase light chain [Mycobacteroides franklinii]TDZ72591.1 Ethanolamine ammonia-lyase light chain [Mycobacteroides franklinii]